MIINNISSYNDFTISQNFTGTQQFKYPRELIKEYASTKMTGKEIAEKLNAPPCYIRKVLREMGLGSKDRGVINSTPIIEYDILKAKVEAGKSLKDLSNYFNLSMSQIRQNLKKYNLKTKEAKILEDIPLEKVKDYINKGYSQTQIETILNLSSGTLTHYFKKHNLSTNANTIVEGMSKEEFANFLTPGVTIKTLQYTLNVSYATILKILKKYQLSIPKKELNLSEVKNLLEKKYTLREMTKKLHCSRLTLKNFLIEHNLLPEEFNRTYSKTNTKKVQTSINTAQEEIKKRLYTCIDKKLSIDEMTKELNLDSSKIENLLLRYNKTPMHHENYECINPANEQGRFKILMRSGDSRVQLAEIYGVSTEKITSWIKECVIKDIPRDKPSPSKEDIIKVLEAERNSTRTAGKIHDFGKHLNISNASFEYLVEKYGLEAQYWEIKLNI